MVVLGVDAGGVFGGDLLWWFMMAFRDVSW